MSWWQTTLRVRRPDDVTGLREASSDPGPAAMSGAGRRPADAVFDRTPELPRPTPGNEIEHLLRVIAAAGPGARLVELIAANGGDGTSTVACNLARAKSHVTGGCVLLADLSTGRDAGHRQHLARNLGATEGDLVDLGVLQLGGEQLRHEEFAGLRLRLFRVGAGNLFLAERLEPGESLTDLDRRRGLTPANLQAFLREEGFGLPAPEEKVVADSFGTLRQLFTSVFIDAPALTRSLDGLLAASRVDAVIMVIAAEETRIAVARNLRDRIVEASGTIIGVILNKRRYYVPKALYDRL